MEILHKSIIILNSNDHSILKHHVKSIDMDFGCKFKDDNIIDFYDEYLYTVIKSFMARTGIKSKLNKKKDNL